MGEKQCYYEVLGVSREASCDDIRRAYKREALKHHPDRNQGDPASEVRFKVVNEAYQVLSDEQKRGIYDRFGHAGLEGGGAGMDGLGDMFAHMQDLFTEMFSGGFGFGGRTAARRGGDLRVQQRLTLAEAAFGCKREVAVRAPAPCDDCQGSGAAKGTKPESCPMCRGTGQVSNARGFVMFTAPCAKCQGRGVFIKSPCKTCNGGGAVQKVRKVIVTFPAGVDAGQRLRVPGQGLHGPNGNGDLYVDIDVEEDPRFERDGVDLLTRVTIPFLQATLGAEVQVPTLGARPPPAGEKPSGEKPNGEKASGEKANGEASHGASHPTVTLSVPPGTQPGQHFTLRGHGVPRLDGRGRGALVVQVQVMVPTALTERARKLLQELEVELGGGEPDSAEGEPVSGAKRAVQG